MLMRQPLELPFPQSVGLTGTRSAGHRLDFGTSYAPSLHDPMTLFPPPSCVQTFTLWPQPSTSASLADGWDYGILETLIRES